MKPHTRVLGAKPSKDAGEQVGPGGRTGTDSKLTAAQLSQFRERRAHAVNLADHARALCE